MVLFSDVIQVPLHKKINKTTIVRATESVFVPPNSEIVLRVSCHKCLKIENQDVILTPIEGQHFARYAVASSLGTVHNNHTFCRLVNFRNVSLGQKIRKLRVQACGLVSDGRQWEDTSLKKNNFEALKIDPKILNDFVNEQQFNINPDLPVRLTITDDFVQRQRRVCEICIGLRGNKQEFELNLKPAFQK